MWGSSRYHLFKRSKSLLTDLDLDHEPSLACPNTASAPKQQPRKTETKMVIPPLTTFPTNEKPRFPPREREELPPIRPQRREGPPVPIANGRFIPLTTTGSDHHFATVDNHILYIRKGRLPEKEPASEAGMEKLMVDLTACPVVFAEPVVLVTLKVKTRNRVRGRFLGMFGFGGGAGGTTRQRRQSPSPVAGPSSSAQPYPTEQGRASSPTPAGRKSLALRPRSSPNLAYSASRSASKDSSVPSVSVHDPSDPAAPHPSDQRVEFKMVSPNQSFSARAESIAVYQMFRTLLERERSRALMGEDGGKVEGEVALMDGRAMLKSLRDADDSNTSCGSCGAEDPEWVAIEKEMLVALIVCENCSGYYRGKPAFMVRSFLYDVSLFQQTSSPYYHAVSTASNVQACMRLAGSLTSLDQDRPPHNPPAFDPHYSIPLQRSRTLLGSRKSSSALHQPSGLGHSKSFSMDATSTMRKASQLSINETATIQDEGALRRRRSSVHTSTPIAVEMEIDGAETIVVVEPKQDLSQRFKSLIGGMKMKPRKKASAEDASLPVQGVGGADIAAAAVGR
ncbi:hypothetical protein HDU67_009388 [Dinochytrium kinnereticum]|nr:hypothetical protein HDU67_009388 [Dinochytrium kinnereticum]